MVTCRVLIIEDEAIFSQNISKYLTRAGYECLTALSGKEGITQFSLFRPDLVLLDIKLGDANGVDILCKIRQLDRQTKVILMTAYGSIDIAVDAMKSGANEFLTKPIVLKELKFLIDSLLGDQNLEAENEKGVEYLSRILGECPAIDELKTQVSDLLKTESLSSNNYGPSVLITGETGTGKELLAQAIHYGSARNNGPFIEINCSTLPEQLVESELFGHEKGAFTGAHAQKTGLFEAADGGTLFLDEIGDMPPTTQIKLLKILEDKQVRRLGSTESHLVDVRIVAATNRQLEQMVEQGHFRADLFYRLSIVRFQIPALRDRGNDILLLAEHFLDIQARSYQRVKPSLSENAKKALLRYDWPGNVRELRNTMERTILSRVTTRIEPEHLMLSNKASPEDKKSKSENLPSMNLRNNEQALLIQALEKTAWNVSAAAKILGISRDTLRYRMARYGFKRTIKK